MDPNVREWLNMIFRWAHVVAGIFWIGHLYFFNFVNSQMAKNEQAGVIVSYVLILILLFVMSRIFSGRATYIQLGATFGTIMAGNVWMRIWPSQRKIIAAAKGGPAVDPAVVAMAGLRSKQNTYLSVPLVFTMVSNHFPTIYGSDFGWVILAILVLVGFGVTKLLYNKAASPTPAQF